MISRFIDKAKDLYIKMMENKKQVITVLLIGITVLSIPVGLQLSQQQQILRSRADNALKAGNLIPEEECAAYIREKMIDKASAKTYSGACTYNGYKTMEAMKTEMVARGWAGDLNDGEALFDAYQGAVTRPKNCVARVQEGWRAAGAQASRDPWTDNKNLALGRAVHVGALDSNNPSLISEAKIVVSGPGGTQTFENNAIFTPSQAGVYTLTAVGGPCNSPTATLNVTANCPDSCSVCIVNSHGSGFLSTYADGGSQWNPYSCQGYKPIVDNWCSQVNSVDCNRIKAGPCASACTNVVTGGAPGSGGNSPGSGGNSPGTGAPTAGSNYTVSGNVKNAAGVGVPGVSVEVHNGLGNKVTVQTDNNGVFTSPDFIKVGIAGQNLYAIRIPDGNGKAVGGGWTWITTTGGRDTLPTDNSYEFQLAGVNDCAGPAGAGGASGRCNFTYTSSGGASPTPIASPSDGSQAGECRCASNVCAGSCNFAKLSTADYSSPVKCSLAANISLTVPTASDKNSWCNNRQKRTLGDADGNGSIDIIDYAYYLRAALGGNVPANINPDFNGDGEVGSGDLEIWRQGRGQ